MRTLCVLICTAALLAGPAIGVAAQANGGDPGSPSPSPATAPPWPEVFRVEGLSWEPLPEPRTWTVYSDPHGGNFPNAHEMAIGPDGRPWFWQPGGCGDAMSDEEVMCVWQHGTPGWTGFPPPDSYWLNDLAVTPDGTLWAATQRGLQSYDGEAWTRHGGSDIRALAVAADDSVWGFGEGEGSLALVRYSDGQVTEEQLAPSLPDYDPEDALVPFAAVTTVAGDVWVGGGGWRPWSFIDDTHGFLARFDGESWEAMHPIGQGTDPGVVALEADPDGGVWALMHTENESGDPMPLLAHFGGETWTVYSTAEGVPGNAGSAMAVDPVGVVWLQLVVDLEGGDMADGAVVSFDGQTWTRHLLGSAAWNLAVAPDGTVFVAEEGPVNEYSVVAIRPRAEVVETTG